MVTRNILSRFTDFIVIFSFFGSGYEFLQFGRWTEIFNLFQFFLSVPPSFFLSFVFFCFLFLSLVFFSFLFYFILLYSTLFYYILLYSILSSSLLFSSSFHWLLLSFYALLSFKHHTKYLLLLSNTTVFIAYILLIHRPYSLILLSIPILLV